MWLLLALSGCKAVAPAPEDLDGLLAWMWRSYDQGDDADLAEAIRNLDEAIGAEAMDGVSDGTLSDLLPEDAARVGIEDRDPAGAQGLYLVRDYPCTLAQLEPILYALPQAEQYPDVYDSYVRAYTSDLDDYLARNTPALSWEVDYAATLLGDSYQAHIEGGLRYLGALEPAETPWGPVLISRVYLPQAAQFDAGSGKSMNQDYQLEIFYEREPGRIVHAYGMWREADYGSGLSLEDGAVQRILLNNLSDWDDQTAALCAEGG
ncbi:MAG: hypothetical protein JXX28_08120 [Deltaproteobacteria bacterium]|nr:hypothetical protein [Deltaproteobacteria bacterium]